MATSAPVDGDFLHRLAGDEIAAGVGIDDGGKTRLHVGFGERHRLTPGTTFEKQQQNHEILADFPVRTMGAASASC